MIEKQTKNFVLYLTAVVSLVLIIFGGCYLSDIFARKHLKAQCGSGLDCVCFFNVVDNRLNINQVRVFTEFLDAVKIRPTANILEFGSNGFFISFECRYIDDLGISESVHNEHYFHLGNLNFFNYSFFAVIDYGSSRTTVFFFYLV